MGRAWWELKVGRSDFVTSGSDQWFILGRTTVFVVLRVHLRPFSVMTYGDELRSWIQLSIALPIWQHRLPTRPVLKCLGLSLPGLLAREEVSATATRRRGSCTHVTVC